jgi:hypothetical protein
MEHERLKTDRQAYLTAIGDCERYLAECQVLEEAGLAKVAERWLLGLQAHLTRIEGELAELESGLRLGRRTSV